MNFNKNLYIKDLFEVIFLSNENRGFSKLLDNIIYRFNINSKKGLL